MSDTLEAPLFRPPHPKPRTEPLGMLAFLRAVAREPPDHLDGGAFRGARRRPAKGRSGG